MGNQFGVDLAGVVDLLARHLYSSPRVYLRELVQNAVDALTARRLLDADAPQRIVVTAADDSDDGCLHVEDTGIGLDADDIADVLATIGRSSKRDELGFDRSDFLGHFGIGLLSTFLVADQVEMTTLAVNGTQTLTWVGRSVGTYEVRPATTPRDAPGTEVRLAPRRGQEQLVQRTQVRHLLELFAAYLPVDLVLRTSDGDEVVSGRTFPWEDPALSGVARRSAAVELCHDLLGLSPIDCIELDDPARGTRGFAYVTPVATTHASHRVYLRHMMLSESCDNVLPDWAFFVRAVLNTEHLRPTASREALYDDGDLDNTRSRLGDQIKRWLTRIAATDPTRMREFLRVHHLGAKAMAVQDDKMLDAVAQWMAFETTAGDLTLDEVLRTEATLRYCTSVEDFRQVAPIAAALGLTVVNAGFAYDTDILERLRAVRAGVELELLAPRDLLAHFDPPPADQADAFTRLAAVAADVLARSGCRVEVRTFQPQGLQAVLFADRDARLEASRARTQESLDGALADLVGSLARPDERPAFVLNAANPTVAHLARLADQRHQTLAVEAMYAHAHVMGHHPRRPFDSALISRAFPALIDAALDQGATDAEHS